MKKIVFPATNRVHLARQKLLLDELKKSFEVEVFEPNNRGSGMSVDAIMCAIEFNNYLAMNETDVILARGDRYEMLPIVVVATYRGIKVIHLEGGDLSGVVDNKVRHAITHLSDYHFVTNEESYRRLINMGVKLGTIWDFGSLDVEFAKAVEPKRLVKEPYIVIGYHSIPDEDSEEVKIGVSSFGATHRLKFIAGNKDYGKQFGEEQYSPEDYVNLMRYADVCVGNSSSFLKEASILGVPVVNVGSRQDKRLTPKNVFNVPCDGDKIKAAVKYQLENQYPLDYIYYQPHTSQQIANKLKEIL